MLKFQNINPQSALALPILLTGLLAFMPVYSIQAILPVLLRDFNASATEGGVAVGATTLGMALISPLVGMISDRYGRRRLILSALLWIAVPTLLMAWASSIEMLSALRALQGILVPAMTVTLIAYIGEEFEREQVSRLMAVYVMGTVLGGFLGRFLLGHVSDYLGWQSALMVVSGLHVLGFGLVAWTLPASKRFVAQDNWRQGVLMLREHAQNPVLLAACGLGFCVLFSLVACFTFINLHLAAPPFQLSSGGLANVFTVYLLGMVITPLSGYGLRRFGMKQSALGAIALSGLGVVLTLSFDLTIIIVGLVLICSGVFITQSATISYIALNVNRGRSLASGLYYTAYYLGGTIGAWICGYAYRWGEWLGVTMVIFTIQFMALALVKRKIA